jgi:hypothetical protein
LRHLKGRYLIAGRKKMKCQRTMDETTIKIEEYRFRLVQTPELIFRDYVNDCINIVYTIQEIIFPAYGAGKLPPDTVALFKWITLMV